MRAKMRTRRLRAARRDGGKPPDATGLTIDWIGVQATGSGGSSAVPAGIVAVLAALRAAPFLVRRTSGRLVLAGRRISRREPTQRP